MAKTKRVRVRLDDYEKIKEKAEEENITYAESVHELINESNSTGFLFGFLAGAGITTFIGGNNGD